MSPNQHKSSTDWRRFFAHSSRSSTPLQIRGLSSLRYVVLILNFNTASFVVKAVESILKCAASDDFAIVIVDNASAGPDRALLKSVASGRVRILELDSNGGFAVGYNAAARLAQETF